MTRRALEEAGRLETPAGVGAMVLAAKLDAGGDTGSQLATLQKQHMAAVAEATKDVHQAGDLVDELRAARERRLRGA